MGIRIRRWDYLNHSQAVALSKRAYSLHSPIRFRVTTGAQKITGKDHPSPRTHRPRRSTTKRSLSPDQNLDKGAFFPSWATTVRAMITSPAKIGSRARRYGRNPYHDAVWTARLLRFRRIGPWCSDLLYAVASWRKSLGKSTASSGHPHIIG